MLFSIYTFKILVYVFQVMDLFVGHLSRWDLLLLYAQNEDSNSNINLFVDSDVWNPEYGEVHCLPEPGM